MTYDLFKRLVTGKEKATVDFKLQCGAFETGNPKKGEDNAELLKDICAMANNGNVASYILVGVADNARHFQPVSNLQLTSDNIQRLVQEYLRPLPRVRVHPCLWRRGSSKHRHKRFIIIQVGPNPRTAFHFARDLIDWQKKICFRRNEVWVRNDATSDIATPDQLLRLMKKNLPPEPPERGPNIEYFKAPRNEHHALLISDAIGLLLETGARTSKPLPTDPGPQAGIIRADDRRVLLTIRRKPFVFRCATRYTFSNLHPVSLAASNCWEMEHGILFLPLQDPPKSAFRGATIHHRQPWAGFPSSTIAHSGAVACSPPSPTTMTHFPSLSSRYAASKILPTSATRSPG